MSEPMDTLDERHVRFLLRVAKADIKANETNIANHVASARTARAKRAELIRRLRICEARLKELSK